MKTIYLVLLVLLVSACSSGVNNKKADKVYYRFAGPNNTTVISIKINRPTALGIVGNRPMVAQINDGGLIQMNHSFWLESPKILLQNYLEKYFKSNDGSTLTLNSQILQLEKHQQTALLSIKFEVLNAQNKQVFQKTYSQQQNFEVNTIPAFVKSITFMLNDITQKLSKDLP